MSSILLNPFINTRIKLNNQSNNQLNSVYNSNISDSLGIIEENQSTQNYNKPEFLKQFDDLTFDSVNNPRGINESHSQKNGINTSLQRNLDFNNGYSNFQQSDMHYDVATKDKFTHNNMAPHTSRRDTSTQFINDDRSRRKLETFTGIDPNYVPKKEKVPLFEPLPNLTWVNGMPVVADKLVNRYIPSNKNNNGNLPFETNVRVRPGVDSQNQLGKHSVYRINPRNIDELRSDMNQKISYENKPLETIKKGERRAPNPTLSKYKNNDIRYTEFDDLVSNRADIQGPKQSGEYTNVTSQRNETENYYTGPAINTNHGDGPDKSKTRFEPAKRESYVNDPTHAINSVNNKPVMTNVKSYTNYETQRASTNSVYEGPISNAAVEGGGNYTIDYNNIPLTTIRELMITSDNNISNISSQQQGNYVFSNDLVLPTTSRENTTHSIVSNVRGDNKKVPVYNEDQAKMTLRPGTNHSIVTNLSGAERQVPVYNEDQAKMTLRPGTNHSIVTNLSGAERQVPVYNEDQAKMTLRPGTNHSIVTNLSGAEHQVPVYNEDKAKMTLRPGTNHSIVTNFSGAEHQVPVYNEDKAKMTLRPGTNHSIVTNLSGAGHQVPVYNEDKAKMTLRPGTNHSIVTNLSGAGHQVPVYNEDKAKMTLRPGTNHSIVTNIAPKESSSYCELTDIAKNTIRQTTLYNTPEINIKGLINKVYTNLQDNAKPTIKETTIISKRPSGNPSKPSTSVYTRDVQDESRPTIRQTTENTQQVGHANSQHTESTYTRDMDDKARPTVRQTTENTQQVGHANSQHTESTYSRDMDDKARPTIRQTTENTHQVGHANSQHIESTYSRDVQDKARPTIKQTTLYSNPAGRMNNSNMGNYARDKIDEARPTIKQTTLLKDYTGGLHGEINAQISHQAADNIQMDERREQSTYNRAPNGKGDLNGPYIDKDNVRMNDRKELYNYVSHPHKPLDMSVMPTTSRETIENIYIMSKPVIETSSYYVNPNFINTLKNNPLVNDIYHQKNV